MDAALIDFERQHAFLDPANFNQKNYRIDIIGAGATGSYVAFQLAKMGIQGMHIWDADVVESHNLPNQLYGLADVGKPKVEALSEYLKEIAGIEVTTHNEFVNSETGMLGDIVFLLTDTMSSRKEIYESCLKYYATQLCIETRLSATQGRVYAFNPTDLTDQMRWEKTLYSDEVAEKSECGTSIMMGASSSMIASMAVWQFIKWVTKRDDTIDEKYRLANPEFEVLFSVYPNYNFLFNL
jgi:molybdopterin/thiamine biosynthesis adenylyltransferase